MIRESLTFFKNDLMRLFGSDLQACKAKTPRVIPVPKTKPINPLHRIAKNSDMLLVVIQRCWLCCWFLENSMLIAMMVISKVKSMSVLPIRDAHTKCWQVKKNIKQKTDSLVFPQVIKYQQIKQVVRRADMALGSRTEVVSGVVSRSHDMNATNQ